MTMVVRQASLNDLDKIMAVEQDWEQSQRASRDQMVARLRAFAEGFWLFEQRGEVVGTLMGFPMRYEAHRISELSDWDTVTGHGYYPDIDTATANALYLASGSLKRTARGGTAYSVMMEKPIELAERCGLDYVLTGAKIPGYDAYCRRFGEIDAADYAFRTLGGCLVDPFLEMYRGHDYLVPDRRHIVPNYYPDPPSRDYGAIVVRDVRHSPARR
ncbi:hypothetical protein [Nocardia cyriacigeorgica]|nr:hypothetical protein [Nocardia cyriacigeorgica]MBF6163033.1 hypothetical protein [Nocardia cyriacigeorgica]MBF6202001.1 hypothetical protein [Nocardia cyriacigeorgica]